MTKTRSYIAHSLPDITTQRSYTLDISSYGKLQMINPNKITYYDDISNATKDNILAT